MRVSIVSLCVAASLVWSSIVQGATPPAKRLGARWNFWPFFYRDRQPTEGSRHFPATDNTMCNTRVLYPLFHMQQFPGRTVYMFKPIINFETTQTDSFYQWQFLWPFFLYRRDDSMRKREFWFLPIIGWRDERNLYDKGEADFLMSAAFPILWFNNAKPKGIKRRGSSATCIGPLFGTGCNILAYDRFDYVLWPLYIRRQRLGDTRYDVIWPFFGWMTGKRGGFRVWPLYVKKDYPGHYKKRWALWPFLYWGTVKMDTKHPYKEFGFFPLYRQTVSDVGYEKRYLSIVARVRKHSKSKEREWSFIWPISYFNTKPKEKKTTRSFWPLFVYTKRPKLTRTAALYGPRRLSIATMPFIWYETNREVPEYERRSSSFFPIWFNSWFYFKDGRKAGYQRLFPLYGYERTQSGETRVGVLSLPHFHDTLKQGFERNYSVLGLFQYRKWADGYSSLRIMGSLYHHDIGRGIFDWEVAGLYSYRSEGRKDYSHTYLFGLVKHGKTEGRTLLRLFYIPFKK